MWVLLSRSVCLVLHIEGHLFRFLMQLNSLCSQDEQCLGRTSLQQDIAAFSFSKLLAVVYC